MALSREGQDDRAQARLILLTAVLFVAYLCVAIPLPIVPVEATTHLGFGAASAGLSVGVAFFATILARRELQFAAMHGLGVSSICCGDQRPFGSPRRQVRSANPSQR